MSSFSSLWRWEGTIDRGPYALIGVVGFAFKHNLDRLIATAFFHRPWGIFNYWIPPARVVRFSSLPPADAAFLITMLALALPFIWVGVALTLRRLRSAGLPLWLVAVFFLPFVNLLFFLILSILPAREGARQSLSAGRSDFLGRIIPDHPVGSTAMALLLALPLGLIGTIFSVWGVNIYGWGLFVALPFCQGFASVLLHGYHRPRSFSSCMLVAWTSVILTGAALVAFAIEGLICLLMALPMAWTLATIGGTAGYLVQNRSPRSGEAPATTLLVLLALPLLMGFERDARLEPELIAVRSAVDVNAPPEAVWPHVVSFSTLPPPGHWLFRTGIAYPQRAVIHGRGAGAVRHCVFSTGAFVEPITVWDEPRLLKFSVAAQPPAMREWTPYSEIHPPHLDDYLVSNEGQFLLTALPGGGTRLEGTTWYRNRIWPAAYWQLWSDWIIHGIHLEVLRHVKRTAEAGAPAAPASASAAPRWRAP